MQNTACLLQTEYFPTIWFFAQCCRFDEIMIEATEHYQKRSYRNRCQISGPNGTVWLSVPLRKGKNRQCPIRAVEIAYDEPWQSNHWHSIRTTYGKTPFFEHYADLVESLVYLDSTRLFDYNFGIINALLPEIGMSQSVTLTKAYKKDPGHVSDLRGQNPVSGPHDPFGNCYPQYAQPFIHKLPFQPNLSILDLLFCKGPETVAYLEKVADHFNFKHL